MYNNYAEKLKKFILIIVYDINNLEYIFRILRHLQLQKPSGKDGKITFN